VATRTPDEAGTTSRGDHRIQVVLTGPAATGWATAPGISVRAGEIPQVHGAGSAKLAGAVRHDNSGKRLWNTDAVQLAARILAEADGQAAATLTAAEQEAAKIKRQASDQAAATRTAAEQEAADLRAAVVKMSAELTGVAAYVTENLTIPATPATLPRHPGPPGVTSPAKPLTKGAQPGTKQAPPPTKRARPATKPAVRPTTEPTTESPPAVTSEPAQPPGPGSAHPRQYHAMRLVRTAVVAMVLLAVIAGSAEIALHGYRFFIFRSAGTGSTPADSGLKENQGPGQPDAPGAHHQPGKK
jgi:hypothetical protein